MRTSQQWKRNVVHVSAALLTTAVFANAWANQPGRMTGGGSIICPDIGRVTHGFELHCATDVPNYASPPGPNNLEINFSGGDNFHLTELTYAYCHSELDPTPPSAWFNTLDGQGTGTFNGNPAEIFFVVDDAGEPGTLDRASFLINSGGSTVLFCSNLLEFGNQQAHKSK